MSICTDATQPRMTNKNGEIPNITHSPLTTYLAPPLPPKRSNLESRYRPSTTDLGIVRTAINVSTSVYQAPLAPPPLPDKPQKSPSKISTDQSFLSEPPQLPARADKLPLKLRQDSLEKLRARASVKQRIRDLNLDANVHPRHREKSNETERKSLTRRAKLSINMVDRGSDEVWAPLPSSNLSPNLQSSFLFPNSLNSSKSKTILSPQSPFPRAGSPLPLASRTQKSHVSSNKRRMSKSKHKITLTYPTKPARPSRGKLRRLKRCNFYRFSGFVFDLKDTMIYRTTSQPRLHSVFAFDAECEVGMKRWHSDHCLTLKLCPVRALDTSFSLFYGKNTSVRRNRLLGGKRKPQKRSKKAYTTHKEQRSMSVSQEATPPPFQHSRFRYTRSLSMSDDLPVSSSAQTKVFSMSTSNLLSLGPPKHSTSRASPLSLQEKDQSGSSLSLKSRLGSLSSKSFANLRSFLSPSPKDKIDKTFNCSTL